jgi:hypothetical protein
MSKSKTDIFIEKARAKHGDCYDYSLVEYVRSTDKVKIICKEHGVFEQIASGHVRGRGCSVCAGNSRKNISWFIRKAAAHHGVKYDYKLSVYNGTDRKITIMCSEHGAFDQVAEAHLRGQGCPTCSGKKKLTTSQFVRRARAVHGNIYDYSKCAYSRHSDKVLIICAIHGEFLQKANGHLNGKGCAECSNKVQGTTDSFVRKARNKHGARYDYSRVDYVSAHVKVKIVCADHGEFSQAPCSHLNGNGCPSCYFDRSQETYLYIMTDGERVKIGISIDPDNRLNILNRSQGFTSTFKTSWVLPNFDEAYKIEQRIHKKLKHLNSGLTGFDGGSEWFDMTPSKAVKEVGKVIERAQQMALSF